MSHLPATCFKLYWLIPHQPYHILWCYIASVLQYSYSLQDNNGILFHLKISQNFTKLFSALQYRAQINHLVKVMLSSISSSAHQSAEGFVLPSWGRTLDGWSREFYELECLWDRVRAACDAWMCPLMSSDWFEQSPDYGPWNIHRLVQSKGLC